MRPVVTVILFLAAAVGAFLGANSCEAGSGAQQGLLVLAGSLATAVLPAVQTLLPKRNGQTGHATPVLMYMLLFASFAAFVGAGLTSSGCHNTKPDQLWQATVDCAKVNPESSAALGAVGDCLAGVVMSNPSACVTGLIVGMKYEDPVVESKVKLRWTVEEVACVTARIAQLNNDAVQLAPMSADPGPLQKMIKLRENASRWLAEHQISIRNSYAGAP